MNDPARQPNRLIHETSPYLKQHAYNPVNWFAWGDEALREAKTLDRPIFLSIGYSACHWCHVMEHESFEDPEVARILSEHFISIKVDREERPDLDQIYMTAVQILTQRGGWPMSVFLTPDLQPFYGGTYFPPTDSHGMPSFKKLLIALVDAWKNRRPELEEQARRVVEAIRMHAAVNGKLPATLAEVSIVPVPNDPLTAQPFQYSLNGGTATSQSAPPTPIIGAIRENALQRAGEV